MKRLELQEIIDTIIELGNKLDANNKAYVSLTERHADKKRAYAVALASKMTELKLSGYAVTLIPELSKGDKVVADARYDRDVAEGVMKACKQSLDVIHAKLDGYRSIFAYERDCSKRESVGVG